MYQREFEIEGLGKVYGSITMYGFLSEIMAGRSISMGPIPDEIDSYEPLVIVKTGDDLRHDVTFSFHDVEHVDAIAREVLRYYGGELYVEFNNGICVYDFNNHEAENNVIFMLDEILFPFKFTTLDEVKERLSKCSKDTLADYAFGDRELYWRGENGIVYASGYEGRELTELIIHDYIDPSIDLSTNEQLVDELMALGSRGTFERNDSLDNED